MKSWIRLWLVVCWGLQTSCTVTPASISPTPASTPTPVPSPTPPNDCPPTHDDGVSPSYVPNAPERSVVGHGHVLTGYVLSSTNCLPIPNAKLEFWTEEAGLGHPTSARATLFTDANGFYRYESNLPEHIHMRISAEGYHTIGVNSYHPDGAPQGSMDFVLAPER